MSDKKPYQFGDRVLFHDENQCEIKGVIRGRENFPDRIVLKICLDAGGYYYATLIKNN